MLPVFPGSHSDTVPPDSIPNSEVKRISADGSVGLPHVRVGHCQVPFKETRLTAGFLRLEERKIMGSEYISLIRHADEFQSFSPTVLKSRIVKFVCS